MITTVTVDDVMAWCPCPAYPRARVVGLFAGREELTAQDVLALPIETADKVWALVHFLNPTQSREVYYRLVIRVLNFPSVIRFAETHHDYGEWRRKWLNGVDRSGRAAEAAEAAEAAAAAASAAEAAAAAWVAVAAAAEAAAAAFVAASAAAAAEAEAEAERASQLADLTELLEL